MTDWKKLLDSASSTLGEGVKSAGEGLKTAAEGARKVAGIGVGSIVIHLDRPRHALGDTISGTVELSLTEPIDARRLLVVLFATRKRLAVENLAQPKGKRSAPTMQDERVYEFELTVTGEQVFTSGRHRFEVDLPYALDHAVQGGGLFGDALRAVQTAKSMTQHHPRWKLRATLDIPWKRNLSKTIDLAVREIGSSDVDGGPSGDVGDLEDAFADLEARAEAREAQEAQAR
ncbi:MAG: hypothetical protein KC457_03035, partial [Myxococcales bacterium]|nr:hypothetical protein [Myxococcales bacterium]